MRILFVKNGTDYDLLSIFNIEGSVETFDLQNRPKGFFPLDQDFLVIDSTVETNVKDLYKAIAKDYNVGFAQINEFGLSDICRPQRVFPIVSDLDGVLADGNRDYPNALPTENVKFLNKCYWMGAEITIHTARYMFRCNKNLEEVRRRGYQEFLDWAKKYKVYFDEFVMGKPSGFIYLDDKAQKMSTSNRPTFEELFKRIEDADKGV